MPNPFTPKNRAPKNPATPAPAPAPTRGELDDMRKAELVALAQARGVNDDGTKAELVDRLAP